MASPGKKFGTAGVRDWNLTEKDLFWNQNPLNIGNRNLTKTLISIYFKTGTHVTSNHVMGIPNKNKSHS